MAGIGKQLRDHVPLFPGNQFGQAIIGREEIAG
jgi:hypothetical protein